MARVFAAVVFLDQLTKFLADTFLTVKVYNSGISFGFFDVGVEGLVSQKILTTVLVLVGVCVWRLTSDLQKKYPVTMGLFLGGAASNLIDRIVRGEVFDWIPLPLTPYYNNLADYAISFALILFFLQTIRELLSARSTAKEKLL